MSNEKLYYKLADYFITVGIDDYHTPDEVYKKDKVKSSNAKTPASQATEAQTEAESTQGPEASS